MPLPKPPKKLSKEDIEDREGVAMFNAWTKQNKKLEKQGLVGVDFYIKKVEQLEAKVKMLEAKLNARNKQIDEIGWEE